MSASRAFGPVLYCGDPHGQLRHIAETAGRARASAVVLLDDIEPCGPLHEELARGGPPEQRPAPRFARAPHKTRGGTAAPGVSGGLWWVGGPAGAHLARAGSGEELLLADIDPARLATSRAANTHLGDRRPELYGALTHREDHER